MDITEIVTYPTQRENWIKTVGIGGLLTFFGFLLVPIIVVYGYVVRTISDSLAGEPAPPAFENWKALLTDGLQAWAIGIVYLLIPLVVAGIFIGGSIGSMLAGGEAGAAVGGGRMFFGIVASVVLMLVFGYLAVAAVVNFARENRFSAAFDVATIRTVVLAREYAIAWLVSMALFFVVGLFSMIPLLGWIVAPFAGFYAAVVAGNLWARGFEQALDTTIDSGQTVTEKQPI